MLDSLGLIVRLVVPGDNSIGSLLLLGLFAVLLLLLEAWLVIAERVDPARALSRAARSMHLWTRRLIARFSKRGALRVRRPLVGSGEAGAHVPGPLARTAASGLCRLAALSKSWGAYAVLTLGLVLALQQFGHGLAQLPDVPLTVDGWVARRALGQAILTAALQPALYGVLLWQLLPVLRVPVRRLVTDRQRVFVAAAS